MSDVMTVTRSTLTLQAVSEDHAFFVAEYEDETQEWRQVEIDLATFEDLGRPTIITVTIQPGDLLNPTVAESEFDKGMRGIQ